MSSCLLSLSDEAATRGGVRFIWHPAEHNCEGAEGAGISYFSSSTPIATLRYNRHPREKEVRSVVG